MDAQENWWRTAVIYLIYTRSYADSNGDGIGDIQGVIAKLDYLSWLGVGAIWLTPVTPSPNDDFGYDVSDYFGVEPQLGTMDDVELLIAESHARGIRVIFDIVPNHTSDRHQWFVESRSSRDNQRRDWYVWADSAATGGPPNNWVDHTGRSAWEWDARTEQWYLHNFLVSQPDLNWWNEGVCQQFDEIFGFWFAKGVDGFRIDVTQGLIKDSELRDNPPADDTDHPDVAARGQKYVYNLNRPERHEILRRWRALAREYSPERLLYGESYVFDIPSLAHCYGNDDECHLGLNVPFLLSSWSAPALSAVVAQCEKVLPSSAWPCWTMSTQDESRFTTRWCGNNPQAARCALMMLLTLRGTPILYYGDELAMPDTEVPEALMTDRMANPPVRISRDFERTPMQWSSGSGGGFCEAGVVPWLPFGELDTCNVESQRADPDSALHLCRELIQLRAASPALHSGPYRALPSPDGAWVYLRGSEFAVALNMSEHDVEAACPDGKVVISTLRSHDGRVVDGGATMLSPYEGIVLAVAETS